jgi:hypothetical protein
MEADPDFPSIRIQIAASQILEYEIHRREARGV